MGFNMVAIAFLLAASVFVFSVIVYRFFTQAALQYESQFKENAEANLADLFIFVDPARLFVFALGIMAVSSLIVWLFSGNLLISLIVAAFLASSPKIIYSLLHAQREKEFNHALPDALASIASMLRAGSNLSSAMDLMVQESSGPIRQEFGLLLRETKMGVDFNDSLDNMLQRVPSDELQMTVAGMKIARDVGGSLAEVLERLSDTIRRKLEIEGKIKALTAMGKAQGFVMAVLPFCVGFAIAQIEPEAMNKLFTTHVGWGACALIILMEGMGFWFIKKIVTIDV